jgi:O-glycosyl hydrolase
MEENNDQWCTVRGSFKEETFWRVKNYFVRMQVTRFIKQGYTLLHVDDANSIAALSPDGNELVLVSQNNSDYKVNFSVRLPFLKSKLKTSVKRYITDSRHNCDAIATARPDCEGILTYSLPRQSISTFVITAE